MDCTPEIVALVSASGGRFAPHFHLPLQHASDRMLGLMRRPYTLAYYRQLVDSIVGRLPHASIGTDMIVGFPGRDRRGLPREPRLPAGVAAVARSRLPVPDRPGTAGDGDARRRWPAQSIRERGARLRAIGAELSRAIPRVAGRDRAARSDARGRHARRDRQLSEGQDSRRVERNRRVAVSWAMTRDGGRRRPRAFTRSADPYQ